MGYVLLVDDDEEILTTNANYLKNNNLSVLATTNPKKALELVEKNTIDCVVADVMMPEINGFKLCERIKEIANIPVIFLTGKDSEDDKIKGLLLGGDDYMTKPYSLRELAVRIIVNIRKYNKVEEKDKDVMDFTPLKINTKLHKVYFNETEIDLSNKEYDLLYFLGTKVNEPVTFEEIGIHITGSYLAADRQGIMVNASRLRKKLAYYPGMQNIIETVWSKGYKLIYKG